MPKIALVVPNLPEGGGVPAVAAFIKDVILDSTRFDLKVISLSSSSSDPDSALFRQPSQFMSGPTCSQKVWLDLPVTHVGAWAGELEFMRYQPRDTLADAVADCDLIQVVCGGPAWANALIGLGKPVSIQCATRTRVERRRRDADPKSPADYWRKAMTRITDYYDDRAMKRADAIQLENPWMLDYASALNVGRNVDIRYAPPGVDESAFVPLDARKPDQDPYILCVARLDDPRKHIELLLEAYALLPADTRAKVRLRLAGSSGPPAQFWQRAAQLDLADRIEYIARPSQLELVRLYQQAAVFALSSDEEGLGVVILEAMACGVPVVSTRSGGPDGIITDGVDGYLTPLNDAKSLSERLHALLSDTELNQRMGHKARETVNRRYSRAVTGAAFISVWDGLYQAPDGVRS
jgi:glycosyltransferase involved in cell wall biosynthesis